ncbi:MAG: tryptophan--tRNA ligase [bacterium]|nr:tryptophan--tRNA ligase [bacterium]MCP5045506.1 tryptophan--tRNA ligase [bacterium]
MRVLAGIKPTDDALHLGNYFGALRQFVDLQDQHEETLYFIADYHSMTTVRDGKQRRRNTFDVALDYLGAGVDPERAVFFVQSDIPEVTELTWILSTVTPMGLLERAHAYKDALAKGETPNHGLFTYPVLMAADILLYHSDLVPVGQDQKQHLEMARDMATSFNHHYGEEILKLPEPYILESSAVVPGTDGRKMSKSYGNTIPMLASVKKTKKAVMGIVTDSTPMEDPKEPVGSLFELYALFASEAEREDLAARARAGGLGYGHVKQELLDRVLAHFEPMRGRRADFEKRPDDVYDILAAGAVRARNIALPVLESCRRVAGLGGCA